jgi:hypothetical protein
VLWRTGGFCVDRRGRRIAALRISTLDHGRRVGGGMGASIEQPSSIPALPQIKRMLRLSAEARLWAKADAAFDNSSHDFKQPNSFPRRVGARGLQLSAPQRGVGGAPTDAPVQRHRLARNNVAGRALAKRPASLKAGGTRASRRSTVAVLGRGPRFLLRHFLRIRTASFSRPGRSVWRAGSRTFRACGYEPQPRNATPRSAYRIVSRRRPS